MSRPLYSYFARRYPLSLQSANWEADVMPSEQEWQRLALAQEALPAVWMIRDDQPITEIGERLRSLRIGVLLIQSGAERSLQGHFADVMRRNLENLKVAFP